MVDETSLEIEGVPVWLETPVTDVPSTLPPIQTRPQELPLHELTWEHFEHLCVRYTRSLASVVMTQLYGTRGQSQHGIDLYVRLAEPARYEVYQCKRLATFKAADIKNAVDKFLAGKWGGVAKAFRIMTSHPIEDSAIADAIVAAQTRLAPHGIAFEVLGRQQISTWLKDRPQIVDDFFSRPWVEAFCGSELLSAMEKRLNAQTVARYRSQLKRFYEILFNRHDPGIPVKASIGANDFPLKQKFVIPEIFGSLEDGHTEQKPSNAPNSSSNVTGRDERISPAIAITGLRSRFDADRWISQSERSIILGGPGSGKSALLRTLAVELLSNEPLFKLTASRWATALPVWVPFSFWTSLNTKRDSPVSMVECLSVWFKQFDQGEIWPLVQSALEDERLLLLVDGLDEWTDETAARTTSTLLQTFILHRNLPAVLVSRPHGFERVSVQGADWQVGQLAPLSSLHQRELVSKWLAIHRNRNAGQFSENELTDNETESFIQKLEKSRDLMQLAEVPLTLLLLLYLYLQNTPLPTSRFEAYEYVVKHFIHDHPLARRTAASATSVDGLLTPEELGRTLAYLAYVVQITFPTGLMTAEGIRNSLDHFLRDEAEYGLGLGRHEALEVIHSFTNLEEGSLGLLVSQGQGQVSFFHRSLQEYLAAVHLSRTPLAKQAEAIRGNLVDGRWREVIVGLVFLCQREDESSFLIESVDAVETDSVGSLAKEDILAEVAFKSSALSTTLGKTLVLRAFDIIETSFVAPQRSRILTHAMSGLHSRRNRGAIQDRLRRWIFSRGLWGPSRVNGLNQWPANAHTWDTLFRELHDEDGAVVREAALVAAQLFSSQTDRGDVIARMALSSEIPYQRAACVEALAKGWPENGLLDEALESGRTSGAEEVQISSVVAKVHLGRQSDDDFKLLLSLARGRFHTLVKREWQTAIPNAFATGWPGDSRLKKECLKSIREHFNEPHLMDKETAEIVLIQAFPQDEEVANLIAGQLGTQYPFLSSGREVWELLPVSFRDHPKVVAALDQWAFAEEYRDVIALHFGSLVGRTPQMKKRLFQALEELNPFWAVDSLLKGWGLSDQDVKSKLRDRAARTDASEFAQYLPEILVNPKEASDRLLTLLRDPGSQRIDFIMRGLSKFPSHGNTEEIIQAALERFSQPDVRVSFTDSLILTFPYDPRVKALARERLRSQAPPLGAVVKAAASDQQLRDEVAELITPLATYLRYQIVSDLPVFGDKAFALDLLRDWDADRDAEVKTQASINYHTLIAQSDLAPAAKSTLESLLPSYGPDHESRRQAAGAGLIVLNQLQVIVGKTETLGHDGTQVNISVSGGFRQNRVFLDLLGKNWKYVKGVVGEHLEILKNRMDPSDLWERLAAVATEHPELARDILEKADSDSALSRSANVLILLSRTEPKSQRLLDACINVLATDESWPHWYNSVEAASDILADQFRGDPTVANRILGLAHPDRVPTSVIMPLSLGWPESNILKELDFGYDPPNVRASKLYTTYALAPAAEMPRILEEDLAWCRHNEYQVKMMTKPLLVRLRFDSEIAPQIFVHLEKSNNTSVKASFPRLLAATGQMNPERGSWCREELKRQNSLRSPEFGYDVLALQTRSVGLCLLESLGETPAVDGKLPSEN